MKKVQNTDELTELLCAPVPHPEGRAPQESGLSVSYAETAAGGAEGEIVMTDEMSMYDALMQAPCDPVFFLMNERKSEPVLDDHGYLTLFMSPEHALEYCEDGMVVYMFSKSNETFAKVQFPGMSGAPDMW